MTELVVDVDYRFEISRQASTLVVSAARAQVP
jgi:hypothetical protein